MKSINSSEIRCGNFTSSEIAALMKSGKANEMFGAPAKTYIAETNMERRLGRSLTNETNAKSLSWGRVLEIRAFQLLGLEYTLSSTETDVHPEIPYWVGSKDGIKEEDGTILEIKCPITLKSFCQLVDPIYEGLTGMDAINKLRDTHPDGDKYFYQILSNAIINGSKFGELIVYAPYRDELDAIRELVNMYDDLNSVAWINFAQDEQLTWIPNGGYYNNLNKIRFEIPQDEVEKMTLRVIEAGKLLI